MPGEYYFLEAAEEKQSEMEKPLVPASKMMAARVADMVLIVDPNMALAYKVVDCRGKVDRAV